MIRMLLFYTKLAIAVFIAVKIADNRGPVTFGWGGYTVETDSAVAMMLFIASLLFFGGIYHLWRRFIGIPKVITEYREENKRIKGFEAVTAGFLAMAAGDKIAAAKNAEKADKMLPGAVLTMLLKAQSAYLNGNKALTREIFLKLADSKEGAFFGIRGLLTQAFSIGNGREALELARKAYKLQPKRPWVIFLLLELETLARNWGEAHVLLKKAEKTGVFDAKSAQIRKSAVYMAEAFGLSEKRDTKTYNILVYKAYRSCNYFVPAVLAYTRCLVHAGKRKKVLNILQNSWEDNPHPLLLREYVRVNDNARSAVLTVKDVEKFTAKHPRDPERLIVLGKMCKDNNLHGLARSYLTGAIENGADIRAYRMLAELDNNRNTPENVKEEAGWFCELTGVKFSEWMPFNPHNGAFNTIVWGIASEKAAEKHGALPIRFPEGNIMPPDFITA